MTANRCFLGLGRAQIDGNRSGNGCATFEARGEIEKERDELDAVDIAETVGVNEELELTVGVMANCGMEECTIRFAFDKVAIEDIG